jgi:hypothetical protein
VTSKATSSGPVMKMTSCIVDSSAYAVCRVGPSSLADHSVRIEGASGGLASPARATQPSTSIIFTPRPAITASVANAAANSVPHEINTRVWPTWSIRRPSSGDATAVAMANTPAAEPACA